MSETLPSLTANRAKVNRPSADAAAGLGDGGDARGEHQREPPHGAA